MAGLSDAVLLIEAEEKSGTLTTARLAADYNRDVLVIPGNITSPTSRGTNELLFHGAMPVTKSSDILEALGLTQKEHVDIATNLTEEEKLIFDLLREPILKEEIAIKLSKPIHEINIVVTMLEIKGVIRQKDGKIERA